MSKNERELPDVADVVDQLSYCADELTDRVVQDVERIATNKAFIAECKAKTKSKRLAHLAVAAWLQDALDRDNGSLRDMITERQLARFRRACNLVKRAHEWRGFWREVERFQGACGDLSSRLASNIHSALRDGDVAWFGKVETKLHVVLKHGLADRVPGALDLGVTGPHLSTDECERLQAGVQRVLAEIPVAGWRVHYRETKSPGLNLFTGYKATREQAAWLCAQMDKVPGFFEYLDVEWDSQLGDSSLGYPPSACWVTWAREVVSLHDFGGAWWAVEPPEVLA